eukprot:4188145-Pyramimonas_sp.AAC.1
MGPRNAALGRRDACGRWRGGGAAGGGDAGTVSSKRRPNTIGCLGTFVRLTRGSPGVSLHKRAEDGADFAGWGGNEEEEKEA